MDGGNVSRLASTRHSAYLFRVFAQPPINLLVLSTLGELLFQIQAQYGNQSTRTRGMAAHHSVSIHVSAERGIGTKVFYRQPVLKQCLLVRRAARSTRAVRNRYG